MSSDLPSFISWFGRLPGDLHIQRDHVSVYVPLTSCLLVSAAVSLLWWLAQQFRR